MTTALCSVFCTRGDPWLSVRIVSPALQFSMKPPGGSGTTSQMTDVMFIGSLNSMTIGAVISTPVVPSAGSVEAMNGAGHRGDRVNGFGARPSHQRGIPPALKPSTRTLFTPQANGMPCETVRIWSSPPHAYVTGISGVIVTVTPPGAVVIGPPDKGLEWANRPTPGPHTAGGAW